MRPTVHLSTIFLFIILFNASAETILHGTAANQRIQQARLVRLSKNKQLLFASWEDHTKPAPENLADWLITDIFQWKKNINEFRLERTENDRYGYTHLRFMQYYNGYRVEDGVYYVHLKENFIHSINGAIYEIPDIEYKKQLTAAEAYEKAISVDIRVKESIVRNQSLQSNILASNSVVLFHHYDNAVSLTYKFDVHVPSLPYRSWVYVDAISGAIIETRNRIQSTDSVCTAVTKYSGTRIITADYMPNGSFVLRESGRGNGIRTLNLNIYGPYNAATDFTNSSNYWNAGPYGSYIHDAHFNTEQTYDFYLNRYGRNSFDNAGAMMRSYLHYGYSYANAFWDGEQMTYGDGDNQYGPFTSTVIVAHEITHGMTQYTAGLVYYNESGALNESFSDIFGSTVDFITNPTTANWIIGDEISIGGLPFRSMQNPNLYHCPDTYKGMYWDSVGQEVHYNSGVQNYWYYLLSNGGSGINDKNDTFNVNGIGLLPAADIAYRTVSVYLTPLSDYADARFFAIQSANDLFGNCSNEAIQCTNAWNAVGVGDKFSNAVKAEFMANPTISCYAPRDIQFTNLSNASIISWDFGDSTQSIVTNPLHTYTNTGFYNVKLTASDSLCAGTDSTIKNNFIQIDSLNIAPASCAPSTISPTFYYGIVRVDLNTIHHNSSPSYAGYEDLSCTNLTNLIAGNVYSIHVETANYEHLKIWIDFNNDGLFDNDTELCYTSDIADEYYFTGMLQTSANAVLNTPLRMRIISDDQAQHITDACWQPKWGQVEDYGVLFSPNLLPPVANFFTSTKKKYTGTPVTFTDTSYNAPTSWNWSFTGADILTSHERNPTVKFLTNGAHDIKLVVSNAFGIDSISKTAYVITTDTAYMCILGDSSNAASGYLIDEGGVAYNYSDYENCEFKIHIPCAQTISLVFNDFCTEDYYDHLEIHNGLSSNSTLVADLSGCGGPWSLNINSDKLFFYWETNDDITMSGFIMHWNAVIGSSDSITADFSVNDSFPSLNTAVHFTDISNHDPVSWLWDFGDGDTSTVRNPVHTFHTSGLKSVKLTSRNCEHVDSVYHTILVQPSPVLTIPDTVYLSLGCHDSSSISTFIYNTGAGNLIMHIDSVVLTDTVRILTYKNNISTGEYTTEFGWLNNYDHKHIISETQTTNPVTLDSALQDKNVFILPSADPYLPLPLSVFKGFADVLQKFVYRGGTVIFMYTQMPEYISNTGLLTVHGTNYYNYYYPIQFNDSTCPLLNNIIYNSYYNAHSADIQNDDFHVVTSQNGYPVIGYRQFAHSKVMFIGQGLTSSYPTTYLTNAITWIRAELSDSVVVIPSIVDKTINSGDSLQLNLGIKNFSLSTGTHLIPVTIHTNDSTGGIRKIIISLEITGGPEMTFNQTCFHFDSTEINNVLEDTLVIYNPGCDTLRLNSITTNSPNFTVSSITATVAPHDTTSLIVSFKPDSSLLYTGNIIIESNLPDTTICLTGQGIKGAEMLVDPYPNNFNLSCHDSLSFPIVIHNYGDQPLSIGLNGDDSLQIVAFTNVDTSSYNAIFQAIRKYYTKYSLTDINATSPELLSRSLLGKQLILIASPGNTNNTTTFAKLGPVLSDFVSDGGVVVVHGTSGIMQDCIYNTELLHGNQTSYQYENNGFFITDHTHPLTDSLVYQIQNHISGYPIISDDTDFHTLIAGFHSAYAGLRPYNKGTLIYNGLNQYTNDGNILKFTANTVGWLDSLLVPWMHLDLHSTTVPVGDSVTVNVTIDVTALSNGTYSDSISIYSNDANHSLIRLPVSFVLSGSAEIAFSDPCINYGIAYDSITYIDSIVIYNNGCDTLFLDSLQLASPFFIANAPAFITAHKQSNVLIGINSPSTGTFTDSLKIFNNVADTGICLTATVIEDPKISFSPQQIIATLDCRDSITVPLYVHNNGLSTLNLSGISWGLPEKVSVLLYSDTFLTSRITKEEVMQALTNSPVNYQIRKTDTQDVTLFRKLLDSTDVLIISNIVYMNPNILNQSYSLLQTFVRNGGSVVMIGNAMNFATGLLNASYSYYSYCSPYDFIPVDTLSELLNNIIPPYSIGANNSSVSISNSDMVLVANQCQAGYHYIAWRPIGNGYVLNLDFANSLTGINQSRIISNTLHWAINRHLQSSIHMTAPSDSILPGDSMLVEVHMYADHLSAGSYPYQYHIFSNDPNHPMIIVPCTLNISSAPCAYFTDTLKSCSGQMQFYANTFNSVNNYFWNFGDGSTSTSNSPIHQYTTSGMHIVSLKVCNSFGCDSSSQVIPVMISTGPKPACIVHGVNSGSGISYVSLGNINNKSEYYQQYQDFTCTRQTYLIKGRKYRLDISTQIPYFVDATAWIDYNNNGVFANSERIFYSRGKFFHSVTFTIPSTVVTNQPLRLRVGGGSDSPGNINACNNISYGEFEDYTVFIIDSTGFPVVKDSVFIENCTGIVHFYDYSFNSISNLWDFGDGSIDTTKQPVHQYAHSGTYHVRHTAINNNASDISTFSVTVNRLNAHFTLSGMLAVGQPLQFQTQPALGANYSWHFGDNDTSSQQNPSHTYQGSGTYHVNLDIIDSLGCQSSYDTVIIIYIIPVPLISVNYPDHCHGEIQLVDSTIGAHTRLWDFGDGSTDTSSSVIHQYANSGVYTLKLTVSNPVLTIDTTITIHINRLIATFGYSGNAIAGQPVQFNCSVPQITTWGWNFGDTTTSSLQNPIHTYLISGSYTVTLTITDTSGCIATIPTIISITTGIDEFSQNISVNIVPNPFRMETVIYCKLVMQRDINLTLFNSLGEKVMSIYKGILATGDHSFRVSQLSTGFYILKIESGDLQKNIKLISIE